jgi:pimeloyl-ACP methyl ester carboxylesterase
MKYVFLPGMDGTGLLFEPILRLLTESTSPMVVSYPSDRVLGYEQLRSYVVPLLPAAEPYVLIAESFGGPLAARIAAESPPFLRGLVLSATFVRKPKGWIGTLGKGIVGPYLFRQPTFNIVGRWVMKAQGLSDEQIEFLLHAMGHDRPEILAARLKDALEVDALADLKKCPVPVLCLYAERDLLLAKRCHELIGEAAPNVRLVGFDTPHFLLQAKPAEALREIQAFTQALETGLAAEHR